MKKLIVAFACLVLVGCKTTEENQTVKYSENGRLNVEQYTSLFNEPGMAATYSVCLNKTKSENISQTMFSTLNQRTMTPQVSKHMKELQHKIATADVASLQNACQCETKSSWLERTYSETTALNELVEGKEVSKIDLSFVRVKEKPNSIPPAEFFTQGLAKCFSDEFEMTQDIEKML
ncbi:MAG: hypothetical protein V7776_00955 [Halopseudomonas aestusnigri]